VPNRVQFPGNIIPANRIGPIARKYLDFPVFAEPTVSGPWRTENFERNARWVAITISSVSRRLQPKPEAACARRYTRFESTNLAVDVYGNGQRQGDPTRRSTSSRPR